MNNNANKTNNTAKPTTVRACLLSFVPKKNAQHLNITDVWEHMSRFLSVNKHLDIVFDFVKEKSAASEVYQDKDPNRLDTIKVIKKMRDLDCHVLIIPTFATLADNAEISSDILMELHEAGIRIVSPYDAFDSKVISKQVDKEATEFLQGLQNALFKVMEKHILEDVDEFESYVDNTRFKFKNAPFYIVFGNKALTIPYSDEICTQLFDFLDFLDEEYLHEDDKCDNEDDEDDEIPNYYDEPVVERDFEG